MDRQRPERLAMVVSVRAAFTGAWIIFSVLISESVGSYMFMLQQH